MPVEARIRSDAVYAPSFYILLTIAGLIGAVGILTNSQILIVGAMVVGPEYNAIMGVSLGIDKRTGREILRGILALLVGFSAAKALAASRRLPLALVDHLHGHVAASFLRVDGEEPFEPPFLALLDDFAERIETGGGNAPTFRDGLEAQRILAAIGYGV